MQNGVMASKENVLKDRQWLMVLVYLLHMRSEVCMLLRSCVFLLDAIALSATLL
jgi:hypothetical protein